LAAVFALALAVPAVVGAASTPPSNPGDLLNQTANASGQTQSRDLVDIVGNIIQWILGLVGVVLLIMFIYGGVLYATSAGNEEKVETGKKVMLYAIIGVVIIALAFALTRYVIDALFQST
jgi:heme/copper-type cytochrome/quinol oxidase subunit 2